MKKALLITVKAKDALDILTGKRVLDLKKWVPSEDFKGWVYIYIGKGKPYLRQKKLTARYNENNCEIAFDYEIESVKSLTEKDTLKNILNEKVVARFWFDRYDIITIKHFIDEWPFAKDEYIGRHGKEEWIVDGPYLKTLGMDYLDLHNYLSLDPGYVWHIKKLEIFDVQKNLTEFVYYEKYFSYFNPGYYPFKPHYEIVSKKVLKIPRKGVYIRLEESK